MNVKNNIILIGMPGAGKSTVGVILAKTLGMHFIDTDLIIQENEERILQDIISMYGINRFLEIEEKTVLSLVCRNTIVSTGGSVVYSDKAMMHLKRDGIVIYLQAEYQEIAKRIKNISTRGIAIDKGQSLLDMFNQRMPLYEQYSDITIDCSYKNIEDIIQNIINQIQL